MADDFDPNKYVEGFDPDAAAAPAAAAPAAEVPRTRWEHLGQAVRPDKHIAKDFMGGVKDTAQALNPWDPAEAADRDKYLKDFSEGNFNPGSILAAAGQTPPGRGLRAAWGVGRAALSPISGVMESVKDLGNAAVPPPTPEELEQYKKEGRPSWTLPKGGGEAIETALAAIPAARWGSWRTAGKALPASPPPAAPRTSVLHPDDVTLSEGVLSGDLPTLKKEYRAAEGALGKKAEARALAHEEQRAAQLEELKANMLENFNPQGVQGVPNNATDAAQTVADALAQSYRARNQGLEQRGQQLDQAYETFRERLSPTGSVLARTPDEAAQIVSQAIGAADEAAIAATDNAYTQFRALPGTFHPASFNKAAEELRFRIASPENLDRRLSINPESTPTAERVFKELPEIIKGITQRRDPETGRVVGGELPLTPERVELVRQWLSSERGTAMGLRDKPKDAQAMRRIIDEFDNLVARKLRTTFTGGDPEAVIQAIQEARGLYSEHRQAYHSRGSGDVVGPAIQKILGRHEGQALTPEQLATTLYEGAHSVPVARRLLEIFGDTPEVRGALKQGLLSHITEAPPGKAPYTPAQVASRIEKFTRGTGRSLTETYLDDPAEVRVLQALGRELRQYGEAREARTNPALKVLEDITGTDNRPPAGIDWAKERLFKGALSNSRDSAEVIRQLEREYGADSPVMTAYRQGQYRYALESPKGPEDPRGFKASADNLHALANSEAGKALYNPDQRAVIQATADLYRKLVAPARGPGWSNTAAAAKPMLDKIVATVTAAAGAYITHKIMPFMGMSELAGGYAAMKATGALSDARYGKQIAKQMPLIADELLNYQRALIAHNKRNNALTRTRLGAATTSLEAATQKIGIDINRLPTPQLPAPVGAGEGETPGRAEGGAVVDPFDVPAEEPKSGFWDQLSSGATAGYNTIKRALPLPVRVGVELAQGALSPAGREAFMEGVSKSGHGMLKSYGEAVENQYVPEGAVKYDDAGQYYDKDDKPLATQYRPNILPITKAAEPGQGWFGSNYEGAMPAMADVWNTFGAPAKGTSAALAAAKAGTEGKLAPQAARALHEGTDVYHGTKNPTFDKFNTEVPNDLFVMDRGLGPHVAKDPELSNTFARQRNHDAGTWEPEGGVYPLRIPEDAKFLDVPQPEFRDVPMHDEWAIERMIMGHVYQKDPEMLARYLENARAVKNPQEAKEAAERMARGESADWGEGPYNLENFLRNFGGRPYNKADREAAVNLFKNDMEEQGYAGLRYQNTGVEEANSASDPTSYIIFDPSKHLQNRLTGTFMSDSGAEGRTATQLAQAQREFNPLQRSVEADLVRQASGFEKPQLPVPLQVALKDKPQISEDVQKFLSVAKPFEQKYGVDWINKLTPEEIETVRAHPELTKAIQAVEKYAPTLDKLMQTEVDRRGLFTGAAKAAMFASNAGRLAKLLEQAPTPSPAPAIYQQMREAPVKFKERMAEVEAPFYRAYYDAEQAQRVAQQKIDEKYQPILNQLRKGHKYAEFEEVQQQRTAELEGVLDKYGPQVSKAQRDWNEARHSVEQEYRQQFDEGVNKLNLPKLNEEQQKVLNYVVRSRGYHDGQFLSVRQNPYELRKLQPKELEYYLGDTGKGRLSNSIEAILHRLSPEEKAQVAEHIKPALLQDPDLSLKDARTIAEAFPSLKGFALFNQSGAEGKAASQVAQSMRPENAAFYSAVERAIEGAKQNKATPEQWLNWLRNQPGVTKDELEHLGLEDWAKPKSGANRAEPITKEQLLQHTKERGLGLQEDVRTQFSDRQRDAASTRLSDIDRKLNELDLQGVSDQSPLVRALLQEEEAIREQFFTNPSRYHDYTLPGGENYREIIPTLPQKAAVQPSAKDLDKAAQDWLGKNFADVLEENRAEVRRQAEMNLAQKPYTHQHWPGVENPLYHMRVNDRKIPLEPSAEHKAAVKLYEEAQTKLENIHTQQALVGDQLKKAATPLNAAVRNRIYEDLRSKKITIGEANRLMEEGIEHPELKPLQDKLQALRAQEDEIRRSAPKPPEAPALNTLHLEELQSDWGQSLRKQRKAVSDYVDQNFDELADRLVKDGVIQKVCD